MKKFLASILVALSLSSQAGVIRHDVDDALYRELAQQSQFQAVGDLLFNTGGAGSSFSSRCSGTLIAQNMVLTAAHCLDNADTTVTRFEVGGDFYFGEAWMVHENWVPDSSVFLGWDIALMMLSENVFGVDVANLYDTGGDDTGEQGEVIGTHVGFGATGNGLLGATQASGTKRAGNNQLDGTGLFGEDHDRIIYDDFDAPAGTDPALVDGNGDGTVGDGLSFIENPIAAITTRPSGTALDLEYTIGGGDSGGGFFVEENGEWYVAGVHSFTVGLEGRPAPFNGSYGDFSGSTRVSSFLDWIDTTQTTLNNLANPISAPSSLLISAVGMFGLLTLTRRKVAVTAKN
ncbi:trypsin-like serine protease [Glaciecola sp. KUL10]|uniref:trypsin-like serine protease n=1 Tax=Glaciecola sp. (strain KUL10) TaxID=2161813 RepID=UPI000D78A0B1|nr:trypsin-like serine protease [Glaciecola sp. KUL10]GBL05972.1 hypothetical protein KUL10_33050 [Glaciecola sp. KUL10]